MQVDEKSTQWKAAYADRTFYFCSNDCRNKFQANPEKSAAQMASSGASGKPPAMG
jgi:YHS domain-containing protein